METQPLGGHHHCGRPFAPRYSWSCRFLRNQPTGRRPMTPLPRADGLNPSCASFIFNSTVNWLYIILHRDPFNLLENRYFSTSQAQCIFFKDPIISQRWLAMHLELAGQVWMCHGGLQRHRLQGVLCAGRHAATNGLRCNSLRGKMLEEIRQGLRRILHNTQTMSTRD